MQAVDIITKTRDKIPLNDAEIRFFIEGYAKGDIPDYQASAWCMAVMLNGLTPSETTALTLQMANSGEILNLHNIAPFVVDKHSTGGVGDKTTLVVAPLVAATGLPVGKMSGRGLGFSGGTIDKLESISGFKVSLSTTDFLDQLKAHHIVVSGQSADLAPADGKFYALRDVTATVNSLPLIAASIMSKKIAAGADAIVLDVKVGKGAFMPTLADAENLARMMVRIGLGIGRNVAAIIADMNQPLGCAVGNALEVKEAIDILRGGGPADVRDHCLTVAGKMLQVVGNAPDLETAKHTLSLLLDNGTAWQKFVEWIKAQEGNITQVEDPSRLPQAPFIKTIPAPQRGYISQIDAAEVGKTCVQLGGGRAQKGDTIDYSVGVVHQAKVGDLVEQGNPLLTIHANSETSLEAATKRLLAAISWSDTPIEVSPHIIKIIN